MPERRSQGANPHRATAFLDGVRGWASLAVLIHHAREGFFRRSDSPAQHWLLVVLGDGSMAVHVFFVLSGFVLSVGYLESGNLRGLGGLALRRYPRLTVPIVAISAIACALMYAGLGFNRDAAVALHSQNNLGDILRFAPSLRSVLRFSLFDVYFHYRTETSYNTNLWTMPVEFIGSMVVFAMLAAARDRWRRPAIAVLLAVGLTRGSMYADFFVGVGLADLKTSSALERVSDRARQCLAIVCLMAAVVLRWRLPNWGWMFAVGSGLIVAAPLLSARMRHWFESPLSRWLGRISFPLYLVHPIVIVSPASWLALRLLDAGVPNLPLRDLVIATTILLSLVAARLFLPVETVAIGLARRFSEFVLRRSEPQRA